MLHTVSLQVFRSILFLILFFGKIVDRFHDTGKKMSNNENLEVNIVISQKKIKIAKNDRKWNERKSWELTVCVVKTHHCIAVWNKEWKTNHYILSLLHIHILLCTYKSCVFWTICVTHLGTIYIIRKGVWGSLNHPPPYVRTFSVHKVREKCQFLHHSHPYVLTYFIDGPLPKFLGEVRVAGKKCTDNTKYTIKLDFLANSNIFFASNVLLLLN